MMFRKIIPPSIFKNSGSILAVIAVSLAVLIYVVLRAVNLSFTHDEALSFNSFVTSHKVLFYHSNNHFLNTGLMWISYITLGASEISLRLPNILAFMLYLFGVMRILRHSNHSVLRIAGTAFMLLNPFMIEFFSVARGYGLSLAFMMMSISHLLEEYDDHMGRSLRNAHCTVLWASLTVASHLAMVNFFISILILLGMKYRVVLRTLLMDNVERRRYKRRIIYIITIIGVTILFATWFIVKLNTRTELYAGLPSMLDTFYSLVHLSLYPIKPEAIHFILAGGFISASVLLGTAFIIRERLKFTGLFISLVLMGLIIGGFLIEHFVSGSLFPQARTAVFFIPLFSVFLFFVFRTMIESGVWIKVVSYFLLTATTLILSYVFIMGINLKQTMVWPFDAHSKDAMMVIQEEVEALPQKVTISNSWQLEPTMNYYISSKGLNLKEANREGIIEGTDYIYAFHGDSIPTGYTLVMQYADVGTVLYRKD